MEKQKAQEVAGVGSTPEGAKRPECLPDYGGEPDAHRVVAGYLAEYRDFCAWRLRRPEVDGYRLACPEVDGYR